MKKKANLKKYSVAAALLLAFILTFAACSGAPSVDTSSNTKTPSDSSSSSSTSSDAAEPEARDVGFDSDHKWVGPVAELAIQGVEAGAEFEDYKDLPIAKMLEEKTGVRLTWSQVTNEKWALQLAAGDLTDIVRISAADKKTSAVLIQGGYIYDFEGLLDRWGPNLKENMGEQLEVSKAVHGGMYVIPTHTGPGAMLYYPMLKWKPYRDAGFPEIKDMDTLIDAFVKMAEVMPVTPDGKKVYAYSSFIDWGNTFLFFYPWASALGYDNVGTWYYADHATMELVNQLDDDSRSVFWWTTELMYKLNKLGLFDPDTFTQTWDEMKVKRNAEQVLFSHGFWDRPKLYDTNDVLLDTYFPVRWEGASVQGGAFNYLYEMGMVISSNCKDPEAAIRLFDYCASYDGAELLLNGIEGEDWTLVDNVPMPTDQIIADRKAGVDLLKTRGIGYGGYNFLIGISELDIDPRYNVNIDFNYMPAVQRQSYTDLDNEIINHFSAESINGIIYDAIANGTQRDMSKYDTLASKQMPPMPTDMTRINTDLQQLAATEWAPKMVYATDDAEFQALKQAAIAAFNEAGLADLNQWYETNWAEAKAKAKEFGN